MRIIAKRTLRKFWEVEPESEAPLLAWSQAARHGRWGNFGDVKQAYGTASQVGRFTVFNIGGNKFRLITDIHFNKSIIYIHCVLTHKDYDAGRWKTG